MDNEAIPARIGGLTWRQIMHAIRVCPTVAIWPVAGPALGYRSKSAAYAAARAGHIRVIEQGRKRPVPTPWLRKVLGLKSTARSRQHRARERVATARSKAALRKPAPARKGPGLFCFEGDPDPRR